MCYSLTESMKADIRKTSLTDLLFYITLPPIVIIGQFVIHVVALLSSFQGYLFNPLARISGEAFLIVLVIGNGVLFIPTILWARAKRGTVRLAYWYVIFWWIVSLILLWTRAVKIF